MNEYQRYGEYAEQNVEGVTGAGNPLKLLLIGMGIGAAVALLVTPVKGSELRNALGRGFRSAFEGISEQTRNLRSRGSNLLGFTRRRAAGGEYEQDRQA